MVKLYGGLPSLWASIHIAGGFAFAPLTDTSGELLRRQIDDNLVSCFLCCAAAVNAIGRTGQGGRIVNCATSGLIGAVVKDPVQDQLIWQEYLETVVKERDGWKDIYRACRDSRG